MINYSQINEYPVLLEHTHSSTTAQKQLTHAYTLKAYSTLCFNAVCLTYLPCLNEEYHITTLDRNKDGECLRDGTQSCNCVQSISESQICT